MTFKELFELKPGTKFVYKGKKELSGMVLEIESLEKDPIFLSDGSSDKYFTKYFICKQPYVPDHGFRVVIRQPHQIAEILKGF